MKTVPTIALLLVSLILLVAGAAAETIQVQNVKVTTIGATAPVNIVLDTAPTGVAGYDITVSLSNPSVAKITSVSFPSWAKLNDSTIFPALSVKLRTVDLYEQINSGATNIPFGTITLRGDAVGSTDVVVTIKNITADNRNSFTPAIQSAKFTVYSGSDTPSPPASPVKLIFIHHSCGENWLADDNGGLGIALRDNNYFVSDTNYGWGPDSIGDMTDIPNWYEWFRGSQSATYVSALYSESDQHSTYSRLASDPGGLNKIVMFKSCFPNSALTGDPTDPIPAISENPFDLSISSAKGVYIDLLEYFATKQDTLFIVITAPPLIDGTYSKNARAFNQWLVNDWLKDYPYKNVYVFDFYNVLTTNGGSSSVNDLGATTGNHHRWWDGVVQHQVNLAYNTSAYPTGDDHPSQAGNLKATAEYIPLLNYAYNRWAASTSMIGVYRPSTHMFYLRPSDFPTTSVININWGTSTDIPVTGDWNGDGTTEVGVYRQSIHKFYLRPSDYPATPATTINWGTSTDLPVTGDWNGDKKTEVGVYRPSAHKFYLRPFDYPVTPATPITWGTSTDIPVTGDWNGDGTTEVGVFRPSVHKFYLMPGDYPTTPTITTNWGTSTDIPVTGDWNGDGTTEVGVFRPSAQKFYLRPSDYPATPTTTINWGVSTDLPVTGGWS